jgi:hypothetical protein
MEFIYAIDGISAASKKKLIDVGLDSVLVSPQTRGNLKNGPGGCGCLLLTNSRESKKLQYKPEEQTWRKSNNKKFYIGFYNDEKPTPQELAREEQIDGHYITDLDGNKWLIPCARVFPKGTKLPQALILSPGGKVIRESLDIFVQFSNRAEDLWHDFQIDLGWISGEKILTNEDQWKLAAEAIGFNYRMGPDEINALKIFISEKNMTQIIYAIVDAQTVLVALKDILVDSKKKV